MMNYKNAGRKQKKIKTFVGAGKNEYFCGWNKMTDKFIHIIKLYKTQ